MFARHPIFKTKKLVTERQTTPTSTVSTREPEWKLNLYEVPLALKYHKVASSRLFWLVALPRIFRMLMKGKFYAYVL